MSYYIIDNREQMGLRVYQQVLDSIEVEQALRPESASKKRRKFGEAWEYLRTRLDSVQGICIGAAAMAINRGHAPICTGQGLPGWGMRPWRNYGERMCNEEAGELMALIAQDYYFKLLQMPPKRRRALMEWIPMAKRSIGENYLKTYWDTAKI